MFYTVDIENQITLLWDKVQKHIYEGEYEQAKELTDLITSLTWLDKVNKTYITSPMYLYPCPPPCPPPCPNPNPYPGFPDGWHYLGDPPYTTGDFPRA